MIRKTVIILILIIILKLLLTGCQANNADKPESATVPYEWNWGIYELEISTGNVRLLYSSSDEFFASTLQLSSSDGRLLFAMKTGGTDDTDMEIYSIGIDGDNLKRLTTNDYFDLYPVWSPDDSEIAFLSWRNKDLDIFIMDTDGNNPHMFYDSGYHDADIDWSGDTIVFTSRYAIWKIDDDGSKPEQVTDLQNRGEWGTANLPAGDYDPRLSPDATKIVFERLLDVNQPHGSYDLYTVNLDGSRETRITDTGYSQGLASWSHSGEEIVYSVGAIGETGMYDIYLVNADGTNNRNITPAYFPANFLCHSPIFSADDSKILFIGQWWK